MIYQELGERHNWTVPLYNGAAACAMQLGNWEEAEQYLQADCSAKISESRETISLYLFKVLAVKLARICLLSGVGVSLQSHEDLGECIELHMLWCFLACCRHAEAVMCCCCAGRV